MTPESILALYRHNKAMTLEKISKITGWSTQELSTLLIS